MLATLLSSRVRAKLLSAIFLSPGEPHNTNKLAKQLGEHYSAVWKELVKLEQIGILTSQLRGNTKEYQINTHCPIMEELRSIVLKTEGVGKILTNTLSEVKSIEQAFIFGSFASGKADKKSDLDLMIIGEIDLEKLSLIITELEKEMNRPINYLLYTKEEWKNKETEKDSFWMNVNESPKIYLVRK